MIGIVLLYARGRSALGCANPAKALGIIYYASSFFRLSQILGHRKSFNFGFSTSVLAVTAAR
jgi:hypothetical protein